MADETMPVAEEHEETETASYECSFHILPTVTDEEVPATFARLKSLVEGAGGTITNEEAPQRFDLAYDIQKSIDGTRRSFNASHFGWVRFSAEPAAAVAVDEAFRTAPEVLRHLLVKLTREEEAHPFFVFAERAQDEQSEEGDEDGESTSEGEEGDAEAAREED